MADIVIDIEPADAEAARVFEGIRYTAEGGGCKPPEGEDPLTLVGEESALARLFSGVLPAPSFSTVIEGTPFRVRVAEADSLEAPDRVEVHLKGEVVLYDILAPAELAPLAAADYVFFRQFQGMDLERALETVRLTHLVTV